MDLLSTVAAAVGGWPTAGEDEKASTNVGGNLNDLCLVQTANASLAIGEREGSSAPHPEIFRVVSNDTADDGQEEKEGSDYIDEIPDLTITRTASFDEETTTTQGNDAESTQEESTQLLGITGRPPAGTCSNDPSCVIFAGLACQAPARSLPVICEQQDEDTEEGEGDRSTTTPSIGTSPTIESTTSSLLLARSTGTQTSNAHADCIRSMLYDEVHKTTEKCAEMQKKLNDKDTELMELDESKQLIIKRYREARDHHNKMKRRFESIYKKMIVTHSREHFNFHAAIEERDMKIQERDAVIRQLKDANEKLEVALKAMTKVAEDALRAKKQVREDLKKLKSKHLKDIESLTMKHKKTIKWLKSKISTKVSALHELESTKAKLADHLQAREKELQLEIKMRLERSAASYDVGSAKRLLMEGAARNNVDANARVMKKEVHVKKKIPKQVPPSPREMEVRHECNWLQEQMQITIQKIVTLKDGIENMEIDANKMMKETVKSFGSSGSAERKPLRVQTNN